MKSRLHSLFDVLKGKTFKMSGATLIAIAACSPASLVAQETNLRVVSDDSKADMFLGSRENPTSYGVGTARVAGTVDINQDDITKSAFNLIIFAANRNPEDPAGIDSNTGGDQPAIWFQSKGAKLRSDGKLEVTGKLTVEEVSRQAYVSFGEDFSGPTYGPPTVSTTSRPATFIFALPLVYSTPSQAEPEGSSGPALVEASSHSNEPILATASTTVSGKRFWQLKDSIMGAAWPAMINDENCDTPTSVGEDFAGAACTGTVIKPVAPQAEPTSVGEDFAGVQYVPPAGNQVAIELHLTLANANRNGLITYSGTSQSGSGYDAVRTGSSLR